MNIILRPWTMQDLPELLQYANNKHIAQFMTNQFPYPYTEAHGKAFIEMTLQHEPKHILAITTENKAIGSIGIHPQTDIQCKNAELGYWLAEPFWNKGIITNAIREMVAYGFNTFDITRIFARPFGSNIASQKVLEKAGFTLEAVLKKALFKNNAFEDEYIYAIRQSN